MERYNISELESFRRILAMEDPSWKPAFKHWLSEHAYHQACDCAVIPITVMDPSDRAKYMFDGELAQKVAESLKQDALNETSDPDEDSMVGHFKTAVANYDVEHGSLRNFLKKGLAYAFRHPFIWRRLVKKCKKANVTFALKQLVRIARRRFIREGGTAKAFKAYMML